MATKQPSKKSNNIDTRTGYDIWADNYDSFENPMLAMVDWVLDRNPLEVQGLAVLELGCGTGRNVDRVLASGAITYTGVDGSEGMLKMARGRLLPSNVHWMASDLELPLSLPNSTFGFVLVTLVLEHLSNLSSVFAESSRVLVVGGRMCLGNSNEFDP